MDDPKPCPMCGHASAHKILASKYPGEYQVVCDFLEGGCGASGGFDTGVDGALAKWNRRPEKKTIAYYIPGEGGFYIAPKFMNRSYIPEKHRNNAVRLVEGDDE